MVHWRLGQKRRKRKRKRKSKSKSGHCSSSTEKGSRRMGVGQPTRRDRVRWGNRPTSESDFWKKCESRRRARNGTSASHTQRLVRVALFAAAPTCANGVRSVLFVFLPLDSDLFRSVHAEPICSHTELRGTDVDKKPRVEKNIDRTRKGAEGCIRACCVRKPQNQQYTSLQTGSAGAIGEDKPAIRTSIRQSKHSTKPRPFMPRCCNATSKQRYEQSASQGGKMNRCASN